MLDMVSVPLLLDFLLVGLLVATIGYCIRLSRKLSVVKEAQGELHKVAAEFDKAIVRSKLGIEELKTAGKLTGAELQKEIASAQTLLEEMKLINASSSRIADRLQDGVVSKKGENNKATPNVQSDEAGKTDPEDLRPRTDAEKELLQMLTKSK